MDCCHNATPDYEEAQPPEAVLWDERAPSLSSKDGVNGRMVVEVQVDGEISTVDCKGQGLDCSKKLCSLL